MLDYFQHAVLLSFHLGFFAFGWVFFYRKLFKDFEVRRPSWLCARGPRARLTLRWPWRADPARGGAAAVRRHVHGLVLHV